MRERRGEKMFKCVPVLACSSVSTTRQKERWLRVRTATVGIALNVLGVWRKDGFCAHRLACASSKTRGEMFVSLPLRDTRGLKPLMRHKRYGARRGLFCMPQSSEDVPIYSISWFQRGTKTAECMYTSFGLPTFRKSGSKTMRASGGLGIKRKSKKSKTQDTPQNTSQSMWERI